MVDRVAEVVREAASAVLARGAAAVEVTSVKDLYGPESPYDAPVVFLRPQNPDAAKVVIEVQDGQWWVLAADGPGFELWDGGPEEWLAQIRAMVAAAVAGGYEDGWREERRRSVWWGTFHAPGGPIETAHHGPARPPDAPARRRFEPY